MNSLKRVFVLFTLTVACTTFGMAENRSVITTTSPVEAKLVIPDAELLPGVPFELWIELRNSSSATVGVGLCADMVVATMDGEAFTVAFGGENHPPFPTLLPQSYWNSPPVTYLVMRPRDTKTLTLSILPELHGPIYFDDPRLSKPGSYDLSFRLEYCWPGFTVPQKKLLPPEFLGTVTTNTVKVERINPTGSDAIVWQRMLELTAGSWSSTQWPPAIIDEITSKHHDSNYYPYAVLAGSFGGVTEGYLVDVLDASERFPTSPVADLLDIQAYGTTLSARPGDAVALEARIARVRKSKRPTTRIRQFGREDIEPPPCPPQDGYDD